MGAFAPAYAPTYASQTPRGPVNPKLTGLDLCLTSVSDSEQKEFPPLVAASYAQVISRYAGESRLRTWRKHEAKQPVARRADYDARRCCSGIDGGRRRCARRDTE